MADPTPYPDLHQPRQASGSQQSQGSSSHTTPSPAREKEETAATTDDDTTDADDEYDGHRPTPLDMRLSRTRTSGTTSSIASSRPGRPPPTPTPGTATATDPATTALTQTLSRRSTALLSHIRSRPAPYQQHFTHPLTHTPTTPSVLVDFDSPQDQDPYKPLNWPLRKKVLTTLLYGLVTMTATWASSCYAAGTAQVAAEFGVSSQVSVLGTSLFLVGFGIGPLLWAPLSEVYGRRAAVFGPMFVAACFSFGSGACKDFQGLMVTRFWGAFFASAPVTNTGGVLGDLFGPAERGIAMAGYAMAVVAGPALGMFFLSLSLCVFYTQRVVC
jgi:hypothetical protein